MTHAAGGIPRYRSWSGPALLSAGFRPFFLIAGAWAFVALPLWLAVLAGQATLPSAFAPVAWHAHEMLFGFVQAAIAGFLADGGAELDRPHADPGVEPLRWLSPPPSAWCASRAGAAT